MTAVTVMLEMQTWKYCSHEAGSVLRSNTEFPFLSRTSLRAPTNNSDSEVYVEVDYVSINLNKF